MTDTAEPTKAACQGLAFDAGRYGCGRGHRACPHAQDPRDPDPARPQLLGARTGHPPAGRPRRPRGVPVEQAAGLHRRPRRADPDPRGPRLLARPPRRVHHQAQGRDVGRPHRRARRPRVPEPGRHRRPPWQDPGRRRRRPATTASTSTSEEQVGLEAGRMAVALVNHLVAPDDPEVVFDFAPELESAHPPRRAPGVRPVDAGAHRRGGQPRHPVHPARPPLARPVRARRPPAADPGDDDLADVGDRRRHRRRTRA